MTLLLTPEQETGIKKILSALCKYKGFILADKMGLGKTIQSLEVAKKAITGTKKPVIIICPGYLTWTWEQEIEKWAIVSREQYQIVNTGTPHPGRDIYIMSYERAVTTPVLKWAGKQKFSFLICDEAHYLKSKNSKRTRKILGNGINPLKNYINWSHKCLFITGTPVKNRVGELYPILNRVFPEILNMSEYSFINYFARNVEHTPFGLKHSGVKNEKELQIILRPILLCRKNIAGLPSLIEKTIVPVASPESLASLTQEATILKRLGITDISSIAVQKLTKTDKEKLSEIRQKVAIHKIPTLIKLLGDIWEKTDSPVIIFVYHRGVQLKLYQELCFAYNEKNINMINGSVSGKQRNTILEQYQTGNINVIIATIGSFGEGITATRGNIVLFLELDWTSTGNDQAVCRVYRKGQTQTVFSYTILYNTGFDKYLINLLNTKRETIKKIFDS